MMLFAEIDFWNVTLVNLVAAIGGICTTVLLIVNRVMDWLDKRELKKDIKENTDAQKEIYPAVAEKVDSVTRQAVAEATETKKENQDTVKKAVIEQAKSNEKIIETVKTLATTIKGEDGTCVTGRLLKLEDQHKSFADRLARVETKQEEGLEILRELKATGT